MTQQSGALTQLCCGIAAGAAVAVPAHAVCIGLAVATAAGGVFITTSAPVMLGIMAVSAGVWWVLRGRKAGSTERLITAAASVLVLGGGHMALHAYNNHRANEIINGAMCINAPPAAAPAL